MTPNFCESPLNTSRSVIQYFGYLLTEYNLPFENFLCILVLDDPVIGWNFLFKLSHALKALPLDKYSVTNSSTIWKHTVSSLSKNKLLYAFLFSFLSIMYSWILSYELSHFLQSLFVLYHIQVVLTLLRTSLTTYSILPFLY